MTAPTWQTDDGRVKLWRGDCLEILPTWPDGCVDAVVTDPPYGISHCSSHGASWQGKIINGDADTSTRDFVVSWANTLPWSMWGSYKTAPPNGFKAKIVWDKGPAFGAGDLTFPWKRSFEECWFSKGPWKATRRNEGVWRGPVLVSWENHPNGRKHPHQKPVWLFERIIAALPTCQTFLDPFMGVGTTGVAALRLRRKFWGIEIDKKYFDDAKARILDELNRHPLFEEPVSA